MMMNNSCSDTEFVVFQKGFRKLIELIQSVNGIAEYVLMDCGSVIFKMVHGDTSKGNAIVT